eukprot:6189638-Pleurochrysis_carterae.AAC.1
MKLKEDESASPQLRACLSASVSRQEECQADTRSRVVRTSAMIFLQNGLAQRALSSSPAMG